MLISYHFSRTSLTENSWSIVDLPIGKPLYKVVRTCYLFCGQIVLHFLTTVTETGGKIVHCLEKTTEVELAEESIMGL